MRKFSAYYIFPVFTDPLPFGIIEMEDDGIIIGLTDTGGFIKESSKLEFYRGILIPGIVFEAFDNIHPENVCEQMFSLQSGNPDKKLNDLIKGFTLEAAIKISKENQLGSLETGKKPGIHMIDAIDLEKMKITRKSRLRILIST